jgi:hypothetical protein
MSGMKIRIWTLVLVCSAAMALGSRATAQDASIEFVAHATPSEGLEEPVRGFPFFLLTKSFEEIGKEAAATYPKPDMDAFIAKLGVSLELKAWMKKNQFVTLSGEDLTNRLHSEDILSVPEFKNAYMDRNAGDQSADFPKPKVKPSDQAKDPAKFERLTAEYVETIRHYIDQHPRSVDGIDLGLAEIDPSPKWTAILGTRLVAIHSRTLELAESTYMVAHAETNLDGQGSMRGLRPGTYWLSTLDVPATVGDARPRWDLPVNLHAGEVKYLSLSNANSVRPHVTQ